MANLWNKNLESIFDNAHYYAEHEVFKRPTYSDGTLVEIGDWVLDKNGHGFVVNTINTWLEERPSDLKREVKTTLASGHGYSRTLTDKETATRATEDQMKVYFKKWPGEKSDINPNFKYTVIMPPMHPLPEADLHTKEWPLKVVEEAAEVYSAWERLMESTDPDTHVDDAKVLEAFNSLEEECADVMQTVVNMFWAAENFRTAWFIGSNKKKKVVSMIPVIEAVEEKNWERGRYKL